MSQMGRTDVANPEKLRLVIAQLLRIECTGAQDWTHSYSEADCSQKEVIISGIMLASNVAIQELGTTS